MWVCFFRISTFLALTRFFLLWKCFDSRTSRRPVEHTYDPVGERTESKQKKEWQEQREGNLWDAAKRKHVTRTLIDVKGLCWRRWPERQIDGNANNPSAANELWMNTQSARLCRSSRGMLSLSTNTKREIVSNSHFRVDTSRRRNSDSVKYNY